MAIRNRLFSGLVLAALVTGMLARPLAARAGAPEDKPALDIAAMAVPQVLYDQTVTQTVAMVRPSVQASPNGSPANLDARLTDMVREALPYKELLEWAAAIYEAHFERDELAAIAAFYKTPAGAKLAKVGPIAMQDIATKAQTALRERLMTRLERTGMLRQTAPQPAGDKR